MGRFPGWHILPFLCLTLTFVFLTQHPFPSPDTLNCPVTSATPQLTPFRFIETVWPLNRRQVTAYEFLTNRALAATAMNFLLCFAIGLAVARHLKPWRADVLFGISLTLCIELTQLTGIWGVYPCAYRQFNVDDLLMNALGVASGAYVARSWARRVT